MIIQLLPQDVFVIIGVLDSLEPGAVSGGDMPETRGGRVIDYDDIRSVYDAFSVTHPSWLDAEKELLEHYPDDGCLAEGWDQR